VTKLPHHLVISSGPSTSIPTSKTNLSPFLVTSSVWDVFLKKWKPIQGERHLVWVATPILTRYFDDPKISLESSKKGRNVSELKN